MNEMVLYVLIGISIIGLLYIGLSLIDIEKAIKRINKKLGVKKE